MKILITKFKSIGDVILLSPLISSLAKNFKNCEISLYLNEGTEIFTQDNPDVKHIYLFDKAKYEKLSLQKKLLYFLKEIINIRKENYDLLISTDRGGKGEILSMFSNAKTRIGRRTNAKLISLIFDKFFYFQGDRHIVELNLDPIEILNLKIKNQKLEIFFNPLQGEKVKKRLNSIGEFVHIHPVSQCDHKNLDTNLMAKLIDYCEFDLNLNVILTSSPKANEMEYMNNVMSLVKSRPLDLSGKLSIIETAELNRLAKFTIVVDTAIMHVACANDIPTIAFFGPTSISNWGPLDINLNEISLKRSGGIQKNGKHTVIAANYSCVPCSNSGCSNSGYSKCLNELDFEEIKKIIYDYSIK